MIHYGTEKEKVVNTTEATIQNVDEHEEGGIEKQTNKRKHVKRSIVRDHFERFKR